MILRLTIAFALAGGAARSYVPRDPTGLNLHRVDIAGIRFGVNQSVAKGLTTADGRVWITADSDPLKAIADAMATWSGVTNSAVRFASPQPTVSLNANDTQNVIVFSDTQAALSVVGSSVAVTAIFYAPGGNIVDTDIIFNPAYTFSTTFAEGTMDLQSVVTHELGHALGANHTNVLGAAMFQSALANDNRQSSLSADDMAFVSALYPAAGGNGNATLSGKATLRTDGSPIRGGLVTALDQSTGNAVSGLTSLADGSFKFEAPAGNYVVYLEPMGGYVLPGNFYIPAGSAVDTNFQTTFLGSNDSPTTLNLTAGAGAKIELQAPGGATAWRTPYAGGAPLASSDSALLYQGPFNVASGQAVDLLISGEGIDPLGELRLQVWGGGITVRPETMRKTSFAVNGFPIYAVTLDIAPTAAHKLATVVLQKGGNTLTLTGLIAVGPPQVVNVGSFAGGAVSPGELVSFFGVRVGPQSPVYGAFDAAGTLQSTVGGVTISFDGIPAPLFYADQNQVNVQVPYEVAGKQSSTMVAKYQGKVTGQFSIPVRSAHPGICVVTNGDGTVNGPSAPAAIDGIVVIWGTGVGVTSTPARTGKVSPANATVQAAVTVGGITANKVSYAGLTPGGVGLMQVNVAIPQGVPPGNAVPLQVRIGDGESQTVYISVK